MIDITLLLAVTLVVTWSPSYIPALNWAGIGKPANNLCRPSISVVLLFSWRRITFRALRTSHNSERTATLRSWVFTAADFNLPFRTRAWLCQFDQSKTKSTFSAIFRIENYRKKVGRGIFLGAAYGKHFPCLFPNAAVAIVVLLYQRGWQ